MVGHVQKLSWKGTQGKILSPEGGSASAQASPLRGLLCSSFTLTNDTFLWKKAAAKPLPTCPLPLPSLRRGKSSGHPGGGRRDVDVLYATAIFMGDGRKVPPPPPCQDK